MKKTILMVTLLLGLVSPARAEALRVLTTTADLKSIAEFIGGDHVEVESLGTGRNNYHFLAAKPSYMIKARNADLFIRVGLELEVGYESLILEGSRNRSIQVGEPGHLDASEGIHALEIPSHVDRSMGDIHASGNPHYWLDPEQARTVAAHIADRLAQLSPDQASSFQDNLIQFNRTMDEKMEEWTNLLAPYKGEKLISYHRSWTYFVHRFGMEIAGELEPKPGVPPSPSHLKNIVDIVRREKVKVILNENIYSDKAARYVAQRTEAAVVVAPISVGGVKEATDYFALIDAIVKCLAEGFRP